MQELSSDQLRARRGKVKASLTRMATFAGATTPTDSNFLDIKVRFEKIDECWSEFDTIQMMLRSKDPGEEQNAEYDDADTDFEDKFFHTKAKLFQLMEQAASLSTAASSSSPLTQPGTSSDLMSSAFEKLVSQQTKFLEKFVLPPPPSADIKLPRLNIPKFSGDYQEWFAFFDLFNSTVHHNKSLSKSQKLQYLKSLLEGEAAVLLNHLAITDQNYDEAYEKLSSRYNKKKHIMSSFIKSFLDIVAVPKSNLRKITNCADEVIRGMNSLGAEAQARDPWLIYIILNKLDQDTKRLWSQETTKKDFPSLKEFFEFLETRCDALETSPDANKQQSTKPPGIRNLHVVSEKKCPVCKGDHAIFGCRDFQKYDITSKRLQVKNLGLCYNCLQSGHMESQCSSQKTCQICHRRHHTWLHVATQPKYSPQSKSSNLSFQSKSQTESSSSSPKQPLEEPLSALMAGDLQESALLPTALVHVKNSADELVTCRVILDSASQTSFITESCVQKLGLSRNHSTRSVRGLASSNAGVTKGYVPELELYSRFKPFDSIKINARILPKITVPLPSSRFEVSNWKYIEGIQLADSSFNVPGNIDVLIGIQQFMRILRPGQIVDTEDKPVAQNTLFGWVMGGDLAVNRDDELLAHTSILCLNSNVDVDASLRKFWEVEDIFAPELFTEEEKLCEEHYYKTTTRDNTGRYIVSLPFKEKSNELGNSRKAAEARLKSNERRFLVHPDIKEQYVDFIDEYEELGHMEPISNNSVVESKCFYLPHHAVMKDSTTTKLRVVFDASCKTSSGVSLNEKLMVGPKTQPNLICTLFRFRTHKIAMASDIAKMYRQIRIADEDSNYQRILWRVHPEDEIKEYRLMTVTYGTSSAPYLATKTLQKIAEDYQDQYPDACKVIKSDFYVDDLLSGANDVQGALKLQRELRCILKAGGFTLRKWTSNCQELLDEIPENQKEMGNVEISDTSFKTLGLHWTPSDDTLSYKVNLPLETVLSKRRLLSDASMIFDPLGLLQPSIIEVKMMFQKLWILNLTWDETLPDEIAQSWLTLRNNLKILENIRVSRWIPNFNGTLQLHGFCDASESAYAAAIYGRAIDENGKIDSNLITAKAKVSPIKCLSIPRLELCGALLLTKLMKELETSLNHLKIEKFAWTDSTIVLSWLSAPPKQWKTFVANRTSKILDYLPINHWNHVRSKFNPADCASRGISPNELLTHPIWWNGPHWLSEEQDKWPFEELNKGTSHEQKSTVQVLLETPKDESEFLTKYSSLPHLLRIAAYCKRFGDNCRLKREQRRIGFISSAELNEVTKVFIKMSQEAEFAEEIVACKNDVQLMTRSKLKSLHPFLDSDGILRVGGRLEHSNLSFSAKHPIILSKCNIFCKLLISHFHLRYLHAGFTLLTSSLLQKYWIIGCRKIVKQTIHNCMTCFRLKCEISKQLMGQLPLARVTGCRAFTQTGVDYAGPILVKMNKGRGCTCSKGYIGVFVCMSTKAIHLELISDLTTDAFLAALKRFISRRGICSDLYSDNGTNFVGAHRKLSELQMFLKSKQHNDIVSHYVTDFNIKWHFNPPASPHMGGIWEAGVKSIKFHLKRICKDQKLTYEELCTTLAQIECCVNSRPLFALSTDPTSLEVLTPGHFLIGQALSTIPEDNASRQRISLLDKWQLCQQLYRSFWSRWYKEYIPTLQQRHKWTQQKENLNVGDLVLIAEDNLPPSHWSMGRVLVLHPGVDSIVRVVTLQCKGGVLKRPIHKLCVLPVSV